MDATAAADVLTSTFSLLNRGNFRTMRHCLLVKELQSGAQIGPDGIFSRARPTATCLEEAVTRPRPAAKKGDDDD